MEKCNLIERNREFMKISVFTPTHKSDWLPNIYECLLEQTYSDWEWVILYNNGAKVIDFDDNRVVNKVLYERVDQCVGKVKHLACKYCTGDILLELDHDDLLMPNALEEVAIAFEDDNIGVVYSNSIHCDGEFNAVQKFDTAYGWKFKDYNYKGHELFAPITFEPRPETVSKIWFSPDHLRAYRRTVYEQVGGYNVDMRVLDDQDLLCKLYLATNFKHIDKELYLYRVHGENTWLQRNKEIQDNVLRIYDTYFEYMVSKWADDNNLIKTEIGAGFVGGFQGYITVDLDNADINHDLNTTFPFPDSSVGVLRAIDVLEHLKDPLFTMKEIYRVLAPGGFAIIRVPSTDGRGAFQDPTHISYWNENSFLYYTREEKSKYIGTPVRFQASRLYTTELNNEGVCWVVAHLISLKDGYTPAGLIEI